MAEIPMCPYFLKPCLQDICAAFDQYIQEKFKNTNDGSWYSISALKELAKTKSPEEMAQIVTRVVDVWNECTRLAKIINHTQYEDHFIPNYLWE